MIYCIYMLFNYLGYVSELGISFLNSLKISISKSFIKTIILLHIKRENLIRFYDNFEIRRITSQILTSRRHPDEFDLMNY
jgi:hypothetical protein